MFGTPNAQSPPYVEVLPFGPLDEPLNGLDPMARAEVIDELCQAVVHGKTPLHDAAWGLATVEVLLAMLQSARDGRDVRLK